MGYRGRLAPSPSGLLHLGHARTFWTAYKRALDARGTLILRSEDLDPDRSRPAFAAAILEDLDWLGIHWQEGPDVGGPHAPYVQSRRHELYLAAWRKLAAGGWIYPCRCSRKDLEEAVRAPQGAEPIYPGTCRPQIGPQIHNRNGSISVVQPGHQNWRFFTAPGELIEFEDGNFGQQKFVVGKDFGDFLVWRRDGLPSYQLAVVVDDAEMGVTEVVRGADLLLSTARQILLARALGVQSPAWFHCDLVMDETGKRLAKRDGSLSLRAMRRQGMSPAQIRRAGERTAGA